MGPPKAFLRLPAPGALLKPTVVPRRVVATARAHSTTAVRSPSTSLSVLRRLARRLFSTTPSATRAPTPSAPLDLASRVRLHARPQFHGAAQSARRFGPGGLGRGPMGPGLKAGFGSRSVAAVGLGQARGYASAARPLFDNFVTNAPLLVRAGFNELDDQLSDIKKQRRARPSHVKVKSGGKKRSSASLSSLFQSVASIRGPAVTAAGKSASVKTVSFAEEETDFQAFFGPSPEHALPAACSPWAQTTLTISLAPCLSASRPATSLSHLAALHRSVYDTHRARLDALLHALEQKGAWLDDLVWVESEEDRIRVVFDGRGRDEVRAILGKRAGEGEWWMLAETRKGTQLASPLPKVDTTSSLVFPLLSASAVYPSIPATSPSTTDSGSTLDSASLASSVVDVAFSDLDDASSTAGFSSAFLSDLSVSSAGRQGFELVDMTGSDGFDEDWSDA